MVNPGLEPGMSYTTTEGRETAPSILALGGGPPTYWLGDIAGTMERTARRWLSEYVEDDEQSVGVHICIRRSEPLAHGERITATATLRAVDGRRYLFEVVAVNERGQELARGTHERRIILLRRFAGGPDQAHRAPPYHPLGETQREHQEAQGHAQAPQA